jgi:hypothetical protein
MADDSRYVIILCRGPIGQRLGGQGKDDRCAQKKKNQYPHRDLRRRCEHLSAEGRLSSEREYHKVK